MTEEQEKRNRKIALITSLGVHGIILLLLLLIVAWRAPNPPLPEYGIELNFGMDAQGSGPTQPETPVGTEETEPEEQEEQVEEVPLPEPEEIIEEEAVEETAAAETQSEQPEVVSKVESPVVVEEKKEVKPVEKPKEKPLEKVVEPKPEVKPEKEVPKAVYKPKTEPSAQGNTSEKSGKPGSQGDDVNKPGDKGDPGGTVDAKALYGKQGGGGGGVSMSGFGGFGHPDIATPELPDDSNGIYEFTVKVDADGYVISVTTAQRGLSYEAERRLKATIQQLRFIPKGNPQPSDGRIIFRVSSQ